ncbi:MAG: competence protein ComK [Bacilli bacterium]|nr:competence protein ComK [Bacilli bacterium]
MISYEVNCDTLALIPVSENETKIIERDNVFIVNKPVMEIIEDSCEYFGSSYLGRHEGTKKLIGITHKAPIIIEESKNLIYFPTSSPRLMNCIWIGLNNIKTYESNNGKTELLFDNNKKIRLNVSFGSFDNQVLRATKLESVLRKRINAAE